MTAGPSDGKKSKVSPCIRATADASAAAPLQVPPYFLFPASHSHNWNKYTIIIPLFFYKESEI